MPFSHVFRIGALAELMIPLSSGSLEGMTKQCNGRKKNAISFDIVENDYFSKIVKYKKTPLSRASLVLFEFLVNLINAQKKIL